MEKANGISCHSLMKVIHNQTQFKIEFVIFFDELDSQVNGLDDICSQILFCVLTL